MVVWLDLSLSPNLAYDLHTPSVHFYKSRKQTTVTLCHATEIPEFSVFTLGQNRVDVALARFAPWLPLTSGGSLPASLAPSRSPARLTTVLFLVRVAASLSPARVACGRELEFKYLFFPLRRPDLHPQSAPAAALGYGASDRPMVLPKRHPSPAELDSQRPLHRIPGSPLCHRPGPPKQDRRHGKSQR
jgi:hypothetical protein